MLPFLLLIAFLLLFLVRVAALLILVFLGVVGVILCIPKEVIDLHTLV
jgi:hypothetical protein